jgi:hypothetical protein
LKNRVQSVNCFLPRPESDRHADLDESLIWCMIATVSHDTDGYWFVR